MKPERLTFGCELEGHALESLFAGSDLADHLRAPGALPWSSAHPLLVVGTFMALGQLIRRRS